MNFLEMLKSETLRREMLKQVQHDMGWVQHDMGTNLIQAMVQHDRLVYTCHSEFISESQINAETRNLEKGDAEIRDPEMNSG